jgi:hypothetical protein
MNKHFEFSDEDFNDPKKFMKKFRDMLKDMKEGLSEDRKKDLDNFMRKSKFKTEMFEINSTRGSRTFGLFEEVMNITEFMITNGIQNFFSIPRRPGKTYHENIDAVYEHYVNVEQLEFHETFINNVNYLLEYYVEDEQYEKCVYLQWLREQYAEFISK